MTKRVHSESFVPEKAWNWPCARGDHSAALARFDFPGRRKISARSRLATYLASLAARALIEEAELTPKPALVDQRGPGAHADLSLTLMKCSAHCLRPSFKLMLLAPFRHFPS